MDSRNPLDDLNGKSLVSTRSPVHGRTYVNLRVVPYESSVCFEAASIHCQHHTTLILLCAQRRSKLLYRSCSCGESLTLKRLSSYSLHQNRARDSLWKLHETPLDRHFSKTMRTRYSLLLGAVFTPSGYNESLPLQRISACTLRFRRSLARLCSLRLFFSSSSN